MIYIISLNVSNMYLTYVFAPTKYLLQICNLFNPQLPQTVQWRYPPMRLFCPLLLVWFCVLVGFRIRGLGDGGIWEELVCFVSDFFFLVISNPLLIYIKKMFLFNIFIQHL